MHGWKLPHDVETRGPNLFREPAPVERYLSSVLRTSETLEGGDRQRLHGLMSKLSSRIDSGRFWTDTLPGAARPEDNPAIPAGYTYLLQLVGHDLVDSGTAGAGMSAGAAKVTNTRQRALMLDTLYGYGPNASPAAYALPTADGEGLPIPERGLFPRNRLRIGRVAEGARPPGARYCPFHDIGRLNVERPELSEALIADPRNDAHTIMAQLTLLMHTAHNAILTLIEAVPLAGAAPPVEIAYRRFFCARAILTLVYRRIIRDDLLPRILHRRVLDLYRNNLDALPLTRDGTVPVEFTHGASRFGHAMVRDVYRMNPTSARNQAQGIALTSRRLGNPLPLTSDWMVDWAEFFPVTDDDGVVSAPQPSRRIGPSFAGVMTNAMVFAPLSSGEHHGIVQRDLGSALYVELWSVPSLIDAVEQRFATIDPDLCARHLRPYVTAWRPAIARWLRPASDLAPALTDAELKAIADDPPLSFFIQFEAAHELTAHGSSTVDQGRTLGVLGSIVVAETILGTLRSGGVIDGEWQQPLKDAVRKVCGTLLGNADALPGLTGAEAPDLGTMPNLLAFLRAQGVFST